MRLTLRTLLAYLDDTLPPAEIRQIGQKVAESDAARELIERIKQVTRRRRLTTPPATGPNARFDANTASEYLDNVLPGEQIGEVEKSCLESDVHLAEIAACHQILSLVLVEPVLVPPTAKRRMYALVQGREAVARQPRARAAAGGPHAQADGNDADDALLLGLPPIGRNARWMRWLVPAAAVLLLAALSAALWMALPGRVPSTALANRGPTGRETPSPTPPTTRKEPTPPPVEWEPLAKGPTLVVKKPDKPVIDPPPSGKERREVGKADRVTGLPNILLQRERGREQWQRLRPGSSPVYTSDLLVSLPGFRSVVRLNNKINLLLWGNTRDQLPMPLRESAVVLHPTTEGKEDSVDLDFTLDRGRVTCTNQKGVPARVRLRFHRETWELTLDPGAEIGADLIGFPPVFGAGEEPPAQLYLIVLKGQARVRVGYNAYAAQAPPGPALFYWNNVGAPSRGPISLAKMIPQWIQDQPSSPDLEELAAQLTDRTALNVVLAENRRSNRPSKRALAVYCLGAIDAVPELLDALADEQYSDVGQAAVETVRHWLGSRPGQDKELRRALEENRYTSGQCDIILQLLHTLSEKSLAEKETYDVLIGYLQHDKIAIRQLAAWQLYDLAAKARLTEAQKIPYAAGMGTNERQASLEQWQKLVTEGKLPPRFSAPPPPVKPK